MRMRRKGTLIVFEGMDGTGKTFHSRLLADRLGKGTVHMRGVLSDTALGKLARRAAERGMPGVLANPIELSDFLAGAAAIKRELRRGKTVVVDRYVYTPLNYLQVAEGKKAQARLLSLIGRALPKPDIVLLLTASLEEAQKRKAQKSALDRKVLDKSIYARMGANLRRLVSGHNALEIDTGRPANKVHAEIMEKVAARLRRR